MYNVHFVESIQGLWDGRTWVNTWGKAAHYKSGVACLAAAEDASGRTGLKCWVMLGQSPSADVLRFVDV